MKHYILAVDLETTGLDPSYNEITEIGAILLDENLNEVGRFNDYVNVRHPERGIREENGKVFNVWEYTGIDPEELKDHMLIKEVLRDFTEWVKEETQDNSLKNVYLFGQNISFDAAFLKQEFKRSKMRYPFDYHMISLESIFAGYYLSKNNKLPERMGLNHIMRNIEVEQEGRAHSAMSDITNTVNALKKLIEEIKGCQE